MDSNTLWQRFCDNALFIPELDITIDISRMRFDDGFFSSMKGKIDAAISSMKLLEGGAISNPDEKRMVGHYWLRTPTLAPTKEMQSAIPASVTDIKNFARDIHSKKILPEKGSAFQHVLVLGIGGSALGPQLVRDALWTPTNPMTLSFCDNTDPDGINRTVLELGTALKETLVIVISKSGGTVETANAVKELARAFKTAGLSFAKHAVAVTCVGSKLDGQAVSEGWLKRFEMWDWVGGRTSLFSSVGLLPAALQGADISEFIEGGRLMDAATRNPEAKQNPAALLALMWYSAGQGKGLKDMVILPYKDRLVLFSKYLQQLVMESLGKERDLNGEVVHQGIAVYGNKGSTDQHAYIQQLRDGLNNFFATFIEVLSDFYPGVSHPESLEVKPSIHTGDYLLGFLQGTRRALYENERDSITITIDKVNAKTLGALIALYDRAVGLYASLVNVNAYHQPGVEAGKKAAERVVAIQEKLFEAIHAGRLKEFTATEAAATIGESEEVESLYKILEHLSSNPGRSVSRIARGKTPNENRYRIA